MKRETLAALLMAPGPAALTQLPHPSIADAPLTRGGETSPTPAAYAPGELPRNGWSAFPGGSAALKAYFDQTRWYPPQAQDDALQGTVRVRFRVLATGHVTDVKVINPTGTLLDRAAAEAVRNMPRWYPAYREGEPGQAFRFLNVRFQLH